MTIHGRVLTLLKILMMVIGIRQRIIAETDTLDMSSDDDMDEKKTITQGPSAEALAKFTDYSMIRYLQCNECCLPRGLSDSVPSRRASQCSHERPTYETALPLAEVRSTGRRYVTPLMRVGVTLTH